jgi:hypothetical protein
VSGSNELNQNGVYGEMGQSHPDNIPGARFGAVSWMDKSGNMWLFGGSEINTLSGNVKKKVVPILTYPYRLYE